MAIYQGGKKVGSIIPVEIPPKLQSKTVTPKSSLQTIKPDSGFDGLSDVVVNSATVTIAEIPTILTLELPESETYPLTVKFIFTQGNGRIAFGDGAISSIVAPTTAHDYEAAGTYQVVLSGYSFITPNSKPGITLGTGTPFNQLNFFGESSKTASSGISRYLTNVKIGNNVNIGMYGLANCRNANINLGELGGVDVSATSYSASSGLSISIGAFSGCSSMTGLQVINSSITELKSFAFAHTSIKTLVISRRTDIVKLSSRNILPSSLTTILVPSDLLNNYISATNWSAYADKIKSY